MEAFYRTHSYLVEHTTAPVRRDLMDDIDWSARLIGIKGTRGVGKTTFLLQRFFSLIRYSNCPAGARICVPVTNAIPS